MDVGAKGEIYARLRGLANKGLAVLVEVFGLVLPFALAFAGVAVPFLIALRLRRHRPAVAIR